MEQRIIKMAPPAPGGQIEPTYEAVISALRELVKASQIVPREFPASYHERFYYARKHAELILEAAEHRVQADAADSADIAVFFPPKKSTVYKLRRDK